MGEPDNTAREPADATTAPLEAKGATTLFI